MLKKLRWNSKQLVEQRRSSVAAGPTVSDVETASERNLTFFNLPAEIRNVIYEDVACSTRIFVPLPMKKNGKIPPPVPSLLLASKQTRHEYLPLLLEFAPIAIVVKDFDFKNLMRITSSLYRTELKALRNNSRLTIQLLVERCSKDSIAALRRWLVNRTEGLDRIHWYYSIAWPRHTQIVPTSTHVHRSKTYAQRRRLLNQNLEAMSQLYHNVEETLQFELQPFIAVFEREVGDVGADPDLPWRQESALMMVIWDTYEKFYFLIVTDDVSTAIEEWLRVIGFEAVTYALTSIFSSPSSSKLVQLSNPSSDLTQASKDSSTRSGHNDAKFKSMPLSLVAPSANSLNVFHESSGDSGGRDMPVRM